VNKSQQQALATEAVLAFVTLVSGFKKITERWLKHLPEKEQELAQGFLNDCDEFLKTIGLRDAEHTD